MSKLAYPTTSVDGVPGLDIGEQAAFPVDIYINGIKRLSAVKYGKIKPVKESLFI
jgi:hypothetical protein